MRKTGDSFLYNGIRAMEESCFNDRVGVDKRMYKRVKNQKILKIPPYLDNYEHLL